MGRGIGNWPEPSEPHEKVGGGSSKNKAVKGGSSDRGASGKEGPRSIMRIV